MSFKYKTVGKKNPRELQAAPKYYANPVYGNTITLRGIANEISEICAVNTPDTMAVLEAFIRVIPKQMAQGNIVKLGDLGTFRANLVSEPTTEEIKFDATHIKDVKVLFRPGKEFVNNLRGITFEKD